MVYLLLLSSLGFSAQVIRIKGKRVAMRLNSQERASWVKGKTAKLGHDYLLKTEVIIHKIQGNIAVGLIQTGQAQAGQYAYISNTQRSLSAINQIQTQTQTQAPSTVEKPIKFSLITGQTTFDVWEDENILIELDPQNSIGFQTGYQVLNSLSIEAFAQSSTGRAKICAKDGICAKIKAGHAEGGLIAKYFPLSFFYLSAGMGLSSTVFNSEDMGNAGHFYTYGIGTEIRLTKTVFLLGKLRQTDHKIKKYKTNMEEAENVLKAPTRSTLDASIGIGIRF